jgi:hypothetical protein
VLDQLRHETKNFRTKFPALLIKSRTRTPLHKPSRTHLQPWPLKTKDFSSLITNKNPALTSKNPTLTHYIVKKANQWINESSNHCSKKAHNSSLEVLATKEEPSFPQQLTTTKEPCRDQQRPNSNALYCRIMQIKEENSEFTIQCSCTKQEPIFPQQFYTKSFKLVLWSATIFVFKLISLGQLS